MTGSSDMVMHELKAYGVYDLSTELFLYEVHRPSCIVYMFLDNSGIEDQEKFGYEVHRFTIPAFGEHRIFKRLNEVYDFYANATVDYVNWVIYTLDDDNQPDWDESFKLVRGDLND